MKSKTAEDVASYRSTSAPAAPPRRSCRHAMRSSACALSGAPFSSASPGGAEGGDAAGGGDANSPAGAGEVVAGRDGPDANADGALRAATDRAEKLGARVHEIITVHLAPLDPLVALAAPGWGASGGASFHVRGPPVSAAGRPRAAGALVSLL